VVLTPSAGQYPLTDGTYYAGTRLSVACSDPSNAPTPGQPTTSVCMENGVWSVDLAAVSCTHVCHSLDDLAIAHETTDAEWAYTTAELMGNYALATVASKQCADGFAVEGAENATDIELTCTLDGWTPHAPCCISVAAGRASPVSHPPRAQAAARSRSRRVSR